LEKFVKTLETYLQPANFGRWVLKLREFIKRLIAGFMCRVYRYTLVLVLIEFYLNLLRERIKKRKWEPEIPESHLLTDEDINKFVEIMQPITIQAMFAKAGLLDMVQSLQYLATLRPNLVIPPILEKYGVQY